MKITRQLVREKGDLFTAYDTYYRDERYVIVAEGDANLEEEMLARIFKQQITVRKKARNEND